MRLAPGLPAGARPLLLAGVAAAVLGNGAALGAGTGPPAGTAPSPWGPIEHVEGSVSETVLVGGKPYGFFRVSRARQIRFSARGPARLAVISRAAGPRDGTGRIRYSVLVRGPHSLRGALSAGSRPAPDVRLADSSGVTLCESRRIDVPLESGEQEVWISEGGAPAVYIRVVFLPPDTRGAAVDTLRALDPAIAVPVMESGVTRLCYRVTRERAVRFRLAGPARLEIVSRLDLAPGAPAASPYALTLSSDDRVLRTVRYEAAPPDGAAYADAEDRTPSGKDRTVVSLGPGPAVVTVSLTGPRDGSAVVCANRLPPAEGGED